MDRPAAGRYRWKRKGSVATTDGKTRVLEGFERRVVSAASPTSDGFTFRVLQEEARTGGLMTTTYDARTATPRVQPGVAPGTVNAHSPGLRLAAVEYLDPKSGEVIPGRTLRPNPSPLLLPTPVRLNMVFETFSADANYGVVVLVGEVVGKETIDACGDLVDGWRVKTTWTQRHHGQVRSWGSEYLIATQLGGIVIGERRVEEGAFMEQTEYLLAQLKPDPVSS